MADLGRREDALAAIEEAVTLHRDLAAARPDAFTPDLAMSLNNLPTSSPTWAAARTPWPPSRRPSPCYRDLAAARPDAFTPDLAMSLNNLANRLADLGRREDALAAIEEAVTLRRDAGRRPPRRLHPRPGGNFGRPRGPPH